MPDTDLFRSNTGSTQESRAKIVFGDLIDDKRFCAWAKREKRGRGITKVPIRAVIGQREIESKSNDTSTWITLDEAGAVALRIGGGIGVFLGEQECLPGYLMGGMDLDT